MTSEYDIFERTATGLVWRDVVYGYDTAVERLCQLALTSDNEHFLFHLASKQVVARVNEAPNRSGLDLTAGAIDDDDTLNDLGPLGTQRDTKKSAA